MAWRSAQRCWTLRGSEALGSMASIHRPSLSVPLDAPVNGCPLNRSFINEWAPVNSISQVPLLPGNSRYARRQLRLLPQTLLDVLH